jgi:DNA-binding transcriptional ArsR family regulator
MSDNTFMKTNATQLFPEAVSKGIGSLLQAIGPEVRLQIILAIGQGEACVCHLEAVLGERQAYISQQLMALREAGVIASRREGRYVFYRLVDPKLLDMLHVAWRIQARGRDVPRWSPTAKRNSCKCPNCASTGPTRPRARN